MNIITNNQPRDIIYGCELSAAERTELDHYSDEELDSASFFRYKGQVHDLAEFQAWDNPDSPTREDWDGFRSDSFFSGLVIRYYRDRFYDPPQVDYERVVVGLALS